MTGRRMDRREALRITAIAGITAAFGGSVAVALRRHSELRRVRVTRVRMGTPVTLTVIHPDGGTARTMVEAAFEEMERLESILSRHRRDSALGELNATGLLVSAPPELLTVLRSAEDLWIRSGGGFDPTVLPVLQAYEDAFSASQGPPPDDLVTRALDRVGFQAVGIEGSRVRFRRPGMALTLDGIAKGYVVDRTVGILVAGGALRILVDAGGDMSAGGTDPAAEPWSVTVQDPHRRDGVVGHVGLVSGAVATSGDYLHAFSLDRRLHHIVDPRTGRSPEESSSVTVTAPSAMLADALSTTAMVLGPRDGLRLLEGHPEADGLVVTKTGERLRTSGFDGRLIRGQEVVG